MHGGSFQSLKSLVSGTAKNAETIAVSLTKKKGVQSEIPLLRVRAHSPATVGSRAMGGRTLCVSPVGQAVFSKMGGNAVCKNTLVALAFPCSLERRCGVKTFLFQGARSSRMSGWENYTLAYYSPERARIVFASYLGHSGETAARMRGWTFYARGTWEVPGTGDDKKMPAVKPEILAELKGGAK